MAKIPVFVADFETTTKPDDCRVWAWGFTNIDNTDKVYYGLDIKSFIERIGNGKKIVYFHNLGFDGRFILDYIMKNGFTHTKSNEKLIDKEFKTIISNMGKFYSITINVNGSVIEFRDSYKKLTMPVRDIADTFKLEMSKGDIDYHAERPIGYVPTVEEWDYIMRDVVIVAKAIKELYDSGMKKLTIASDSLAEYKRLMTTKAFQRFFPILTNDVDESIRLAYKGGFTYADPRYRLQRGLQGIVFDVNSLYPYVMRTKLLPYLYPEFVEGDVAPTDDYPLTISSRTITAKLKPHHVPCIQIKNNPHFSSVEYLREIKQPTTISGTNVDWALWNDHYEIETYEYLGGYRFKATYGLFNSYIDKWNEVKANSTGGRRAIAKLHLNSLYGKFATNPDVTPKIPYLKDNAVSYKMGGLDTRDPVYTAMGAFITAYARDHTIRAAQENYAVFAYADTDSLHLITGTVPDNLRVHPTELGAWSLEYRFDDALFIGAKKYLEQRIDGRRENHIAGVPIESMDKLSIDDIKDGMVIGGKLQPMTVPGGVVLKEVDYTLKF